MDGTADERTGIVIDYNSIKQVVSGFDHQVILNRDDPMVSCLEQFHPVITTPGDPTSERIADTMAGMIDAEAMRQNLDARVAKIRIWESTSCYAECTYENH